ncbi:MAG: HlyD family efflux transporter periplasmic adaptor subunit [Myxococcota bacterium]
MSTRSASDKLPLPVAKARPEAAPSPWRKRRWLLALVPALALMGLAGRGWRQQRASSSPPPVVESDLVGLGRLAPIGDVVTVAAPYGAGDARVASLRVEEGTVVKAGDVLAVLDSEPALRAAVSVARATVELRRASEAQVRSSVGVNRQELWAQLERARVTERLAAAERARAEALFGENATTQRNLDQRRTRHLEAEKEVTRLRAALGRYAAGQSGVAPDAWVAAQSVRAAEAELHQAEIRLEQAFVRAPTAGTVLRISARPGERPGQDGLLALGDVRQMKVDVEVHESHAPRVSIGQRVTITGRALTRALSGRVVRRG